MRAYVVLGLLAIFLLAVGCSPTLHSVKLVNRTSRTIEEIYVYPVGSTNHGASRGKLAPDATTELKVPAGNVEVMAVSQKVLVDAKTRDTRTASQAVELKGPRELVFHDSDQNPPDLRRPNTLGVVFRVVPGAKSEDAPADDTAPDVEPAPAP